MVDGQNAGIEFRTWINDKVVKESDLTDDFEMAFFAGGAASGFHKIPLDAEFYGNVLAECFASIGDNAIFSCTTYYKRLKGSVFIVDQDKKTNYLQIFKCPPSEMTIEFIRAESKGDRPPMSLPDYPYGETIPL